MRDKKRPHWEGPGLDAWEAFTPAQISELMAGSGVAWAVVGGWAIDLWLGQQTRAHSDLEIAIPRNEFAAIRRWLGNYAFHVVGDGEVRRLSVNEIPPTDRHQNWLLEEPAGKWRVDVMLEGGDRRTWVCRRDEQIQAPRDEVILEHNGIPYLAPQCVLLFKAKAARDKDVADFEACLPTLSDSIRTWLKLSLRTVHPDHPWLKRLA